MRIDIERRGGISILRIEGEVTLGEARTLRRALAQPAQIKAVIVVLEAVPYIDSSGIATLFEASQRTRKAGGRFELAAPTTQVREVLRLCRIETLFSIHETLEAALEAVASPAAA